MAQALLERYENRLHGGQPCDRMVVTGMLPGRATHRAWRVSARQGIRILDYARVPSRCVMRSARVRKNWRNFGGDSDRAYRQGAHLTPAKGDVVTKVLTQAPTIAAEYWVATRASVAWSRRFSASANTGA